ncbi:TolC family protein [uncultured Christiangramia sp.]|uniref:TolC family protein n=1 Tax=uncultured Christiangramia sp. TaxID=503836 RepID=UPI0025F96ABD|nr:TolC family protein [uncultured Christiangramia sp.]|tara:strand:- start:690 stop:2033 length:1344 start_codon:yes stop_codon:yes gene_type:complete
MTLRKYILSFLIVLFWSMGSNAQDSLDSLLTKQEVISRALDENFGIRIAENNVEIADNNQNILNSGYLPTLTGLAGANYDLNDRVTEPENGETVDQRGIESNRYNASINLGYTLFDGLGRLYNYRSLQEQYDLSQLEARETIENTILQIMSVYYEVARLSENINVLEETLEISKNRVTRAQYQFEYGQANNLVVLNARVDVNNDSISLIETEQLLKNTKRDLNVLLNREITANEFSVDTTVTFISDLELDSFVTEAELHNVSLLQIEQSLEISDYDIKINKSGYLPSIDLTGSYGWNLNRSAATAFFPGSTTTTDGLAAGVSLRWDLFDGGFRNIQVRNSKIRYQNQQIQKEQLISQVQRDIANSLGNYRNKLFILKVQEENVETNLNNFNRSEEQYKLGRISSIEFRQAQINLLDARTSLNLAKYDAKLAELQVLQLTGQLLNVNL